MRRVISGGIAAAVFGAACLAAFARPADLMPKPLEGWTASNPVYGESVIAEQDAGAARPAPPKRIEVSRVYESGASGLRIALNTHDRRGVQIISHVNRLGGRDPEAAAALAAKGIVPFSFASLQGVAMHTEEDGDVTGAALKLGEHGTLTLEGISDGEPSTVALEHVKAYLEHTDLERMADFIRKTNTAREQSAQE
ncbi:MAG: hypothetical protein ACLFWF_11195 [Alphaproteobacteria bacterium]